MASHRIVPYRIVLSCVVLCRHVLPCVVLSCDLLHSIELYCISLVLCSDLLSRYVFFVLCLLCCVEQVCFVI